jgi:hypothetical protein
MRISRVMAAALMLVFCILTAAAQKTEQWSEFSSAERGFATSFPGTPAVSSKPGRGPDTQYFYYLAQGPREFLITLVEFPSGAQLRPPTDDIYAAMLNNYARGGGFRIIEQRYTTVAGQKAIEATLYNPERNLTGLVDIIILGRQYYSISSGGPKGDASSSDARRFRDSFHLLPK